MEQRSLFSLPEPTKKLTNHASKMKFALEIYSSRGLTLEAISSPKILGRKVSVLRLIAANTLSHFPTSHQWLCARKKKMAKKIKPVSQLQRDYIAALAKKGRDIHQISSATGLAVPVVHAVIKSSEAA